MLNVILPPFSQEDVAAEMFCDGWDSAAAVLGNPTAHYRSPQPAYWRAYEQGFGLALDTPFTFGLADLGEQVKSVACRRRKLRKMR